MERPGRGVGSGGGAKSQPGRAGCRCGGGLKGPEASARRMQAGRGRGRVWSTAHQPRGARGGAGTGPRTHRPIGRAALVALSQAEARRAQPPQQQAAPPQPPRSILTLTRAPQPRATLRRRKWRRRRRARPTMLCAVTSPALAPPGGAQGKLRLGSAAGSSPRASDPCVVAFPRRASTRGGREERQAARTHPLRLAPGRSSRSTSSLAQRAGLPAQVAPGPRTAAWHPSRRPDSAAAGWRGR